MTTADYQQTVLRLLERLSLEAGAAPDADNLGLRFDGDITVNLEYFSAGGGAQLALTCKVADTGEFGTYEDACRYIATGNYFWMRANGCTLSTHEATRAVYAQYALPLALLRNDFGVTDAGLNELEQALGNLVDFVRQVRARGARAPNE